MDIKQLDLEPGFGFKGSVSISLQGIFLASIRLSIGYCGLDVIVNKLAIGKARLLNGLVYDKTISSIPIDGQFILMQDIAQNLQSLIDALLVNDNEEKDVSIGVTGLELGSSIQDKMIAFSKIIVELDVSEIKKLLDLNSIFTFIQSSGIISSLVSPGMFSIEGVDVNVVSSSNLQVSFDSMIRNPTQFSVSLGAMGVSIGVDDEPFADIKLSPIKISTGFSPFSNSISIALNNRLDSGLPSKIADLVNQIIQKSSSHDYFLTIQHFYLYHPNNPNGPGTINMLYPISIKLSTSLLLNLISTVSLLGEHSIVDISKLLPNLKDIQLFHPQLHSVELDAQPHRSLFLGVSASLFNPLPISLKVPYFKATVSLDNDEFVTLETQGLVLKRHDTSLNLQNYVKFGNSVELANNVAFFVKNLIYHGRIESSIGIKDVSFGSSSHDVNHLFSIVNLQLKALNPFLNRYIPSIRNQVLIYGQSMVTSFLRKNDIESKNNVLLFGLGNYVSIQVQNADVGFHPEQKIKIILQAKLDKFPFNVKMALPFVHFAIGLQDVARLNIELNNVYINHDVHLEVTCQILELQNLDSVLSNIILSPDSVSAIFDKQLEIYNLAFGYNSLDAISSLEKVHLHLYPRDAKPIYFKFLDWMRANLNITNLITYLDPYPTQLHVASLQHQTLETKFAVDFKKYAFPFKIHGLNYIHFNLFIDHSEFISIHCDLFDLNMMNGELKLSANVQFPSSIEIL